MVTTRPPKTIVKPTALGPVANTDTKFLIYGLSSFGTGRGPAIPLADEMGAGRNRTLRERRPAWCLVLTMAARARRVASRRVFPAMGPALAFVQENSAQENARERAWRSSPKGLLARPAVSWRSPNRPKRRSGQPLYSAASPNVRSWTIKSSLMRDFRVRSLTARSSPHSRFEPSAVRTPGGNICRSPPAASGVGSQPCGAKYPRF